MEKVFSKKSSYTISLILLIVGVFLVGPSARAGWAVDLVSGIMGVLVSALGSLLVLTIDGLIAVASYQNFIGSQAVVMGWKVVRDLCNMFFVVVLMIIAFGTILPFGDGKYNYKKWLPKLILMAILINFSKTICGLLIDVSQVAMLTFVNAFQSVAGGNFTEILGLTDIVKLANSEQINDWAVAAAYLLGIIYLLVSIAVIVTMMMMLVVRIVMIWIYVVLSPLAYLMSAFPGGQKYSSQWWDEFTKNLIVGPVLAFFLWLSLAALSAEKNVVALSSNGFNEISQLSYTATTGGTVEALTRFVIGIGMLIGGLKITQGIGGAAGGLAGKGMAAINKGKSIGLGGLAAVTGARYVSGVAKNYSAMRKSKREESYRLGAEKLTSVVGRTKKAVIADPYNKIKNAAFGRNAERAKELKKEASQERERVKNMRDDFKNKRNFTLDNGNTMAFDSVSGQWNEASITGTPITHVTPADAKTNLDASVVRLETNANNKDTAAGLALKKQAKIDKGLKIATIALAPVMIGAGFAFGGGVMGAAALGMLGGAGIGLNKGLKNAGKTDLSLASNYRFKQVSEGKDKMKLDSNDEVLATMDDQTKSAFTRAAASMEAIDRGLLSLTQVIAIKNQLKNNLGGTDASGNWKDKKIGSYVEAMVEKKYQGASSTFQDLSDPDPAKKESARRKVADGVQQGIYNLSSLDSGTLENKNVMEIVADNTKTSEFLRQYRTLSTDKQVKTVDGLKATKTFKAKEKLGRIVGLEVAFPTSASVSPANAKAEREQALANFSFEDLQQAITSGDENLVDGIINTINNAKTAPGVALTPTNLDKLLKSAIVSLRGSSNQAVDLRSKLGI